MPVAEFVTDLPQFILSLNLRKGIIAVMMLALD
jgi:hypothetical protein